MAVKLLKVRYRPKVAEVVIDDGGTVRTFHKWGFKKGTALKTLTAWVTECVQRARAEEAAEAKRLADETAETKADKVLALLTWARDNIDDPTVREGLKIVASAKVAKAVS